MLLKTTVSRKNFSFNITVTYLAGVPPSYHWTHICETIVKNYHKNKQKKLQFIDFNTKMVMYLPFLFCDDQKVCEEEHVYLDSRELLPKRQFTFISSPHKMCQFTFPDEPSHPIVKYSQPTFLSQCEWPSIAPIQNKRQNYSSVSINL